MGQKRDCPAQNGTVGRSALGNNSTRAWEGEGPGRVLEPGRGHGSGRGQEPGMRYGLRGTW